MRIDKFLKNSRLIKRRTVAKEACDSGRIFLNEKPAKAGSIVKVGDIITIKFGTREISIEVAELIDSSRKELAPTMYKSLSQEEIRPLDDY